MCFEKLLCMAFYNSKIGVWNDSQTMFDSFQNSNFKAKKLSFMVFGTLTCIHMPMYACACMKHAYTELEHACAYSCMRTHALGFPWYLFSKDNLFYS